MHEKSLTLHNYIIMTGFDSEIYIIPARLDNCQIPDIRLELLRYIDLFPDWTKGINQILKTMNVEIKPEKELTISLKALNKVIFCHLTLML
jgi:hypothetical protein